MYRVILLAEDSLKSAYFFTKTCSRTNSLFFLFLSQLKIVDNNACVLHMALKVYFDFTLERNVERHTVCCQCNVMFFCSENILSVIIVRKCIIFHYCLQDNNIMLLDFSFPLFVSFIAKFHLELHQKILL